MRSRLSFPLVVAALLVVIALLALAVILTTRSSLSGSGGSASQNPRPAEDAGSPQDGSPDEPPPVQNAQEPSSDESVQQLQPLQGGLSETGSGPGQTPPVDLPQDVYRVLVRSDQPLGSLAPVVEEGVCGEYPIFANLPGPFEGSATYRSTGCRIHFVVTGTTGDWALAVEPVSQDGPLTAPVTLSGDAPATTGLIDMPQGEYPIVIETESPYTQVIPVVVDGPCLERPIFLLSEPGTFETTYESRGCQIIFQVSSVTASWELAIQPGA